MAAAIKREWKERFRHFRVKLRVGIKGRGTNRFAFSARSNGYLWFIRGEHGFNFFVLCSIVLCVCVLHFLREGPNVVRAPFFGR